MVIPYLHLRVGFPETLVRNYHYSLRNSAEEGSFLLIFSNPPPPILSYEKTAQTTVPNCQTLCNFILSDRCVCVGGQILCQFILYDRWECAGGQTLCQFILSDRCLCVGGQTLCQFIVYDICLCTGGQTLYQFILYDRCLCAGGQNTCNSVPLPHHQAQYPSRHKIASLPVSFFDGYFKLQCEKKIGIFK